MRKLQPRISPTRSLRRLVFVVAVASGLLLLVRGQASAFVQSANNMPDDAWRHLNGLEWGQIRRDWSSHGLNGDANPINPYCRIEVTEVYDVPASSSGNPRRAFRFKVIGNADGRAHAFEAGGYVDSTTDNCQNIHNTAWDGQTVNLNDSIFRNPAGSNATRQRPINVALGLTATQEANAQPVRAGVPAFRQENLADWDEFDVDMKRQAGIKPTTQGGGYGYIADGGGYKVNGQTIWCAGVDIGNLTGVSNIQWPGSFFNDCRWDHRFKAGTNSPGDGNFETNWGAYAKGAMGTRTLDGNNNETNISSPAIRCISQPCPVGSTIPRLQREADGSVRNFELILAGIKNHDGAGTFQGNPDFNGFPAPFNNVDWRARNLTDNPFQISFTEAWLTMEWDPAGVVEPTPEVTCQIVTSPLDPEPGQPFNVRMNYTFTGEPAVLEGRGNFTSPGISNTVVNVGPESVGDSDTGGEVSGSFSMGSYTAGAGVYDFDALLRIRDRITIRDDCDKRVVIAAKPYFKVWSNDTQVGGNFAGANGQCSPAIVTGQEDATVIGYGGDGITDIFRGSSTEFGLSTLGEIRNFFSASQRSPRNANQTTWPTPPHGLTFANAQIDGISSPDPRDPNKVVNYGGFSGQASCATNWLGLVSDETPQTMNNSININTVSGTVRNTATGTVRISGGTVTQPTAIFLTEADNVIIEGNIGVDADSTLYIITDGNIKVQSDVGAIYAALITTKTLETCTQDNGAAWAQADLYANCNRQLNIRGAVIANQIKLRRTFGTRHSSVQNEPAIPNAAAEQIIFDTALYTIRPGFETPPSQKSEIDFMTSLPPIL